MSDRTSSPVEKDPCPCCLEPGVSIFHTVNRVPVHSVLNIPTRQQALDFTRGDITLGFCSRCGFISNTVFDPSLMHYSGDCEESQGCSPTFHQFLERSTAELIDKHDLHGKKIIEIGCGKGEFLELICTMGGNTGVGFDPAYVPDRHGAHRSGKTTYVTDYYSEKYADYHGDMICCRMTLEHVPKPHEMVSLVRRTIGGNTDVVVFFQLPNVMRVLDTCAFEDIYYEHCSYFSAGSLARLFRNCGFSVTNLELVYDGQYILIECKPSDSPTQCEPGGIEDDLSRLSDLTATFDKRCADVLEPWKRFVVREYQKGRKVVLWGSGSKAVSFLVRLGIVDEISRVVDINPHRQGTFMAGTGQEIISPAALKDYEPDTVIMMNSVYWDEIAGNIESMGLSPVLTALGRTIPDDE